MPSAYKEVWLEAYDEARENGLSEAECEKVADEAVQDWIEGLYERAKERLREESDNASNAPTGGANT